MKKIILILMVMAGVVFAGNFQKKSDNTVTRGVDEEQNSRVDTVYIEKPVEYRYGRVYVRKTTYSTGTEHNQGVRVYYKSTAPSHCTNPNCKDRHIH